MVEITEDEVPCTTATEFKTRGNEYYSVRNYTAAIEAYNKAVDLSKDGECGEFLATLHANIGACYLKLEAFEKTVEACDVAIELKPGYIKALLRKASALKNLDKISDADKVVDEILVIEPRNSQALTLKKELAQAFEAKKEEMMSQLKELGNGILGNFGMSLDNFETVKDPETGSYSIKMR